MANYLSRTIYPNADTALLPNYAVDFDYLLPTHLVVMGQLAGEEAAVLTRGVDYTLEGASTVHFLLSYQFASLIIKRVTPRDVLLSGTASTSSISSGELKTNFIQLLYIAQEQQDDAAQGVTGADGTTSLLALLADPTGASLIGTRDSALGAVPRTFAQARTDEPVTPQAVGALGNNTGDDWEAMVAFFQATPGKRRGHIPLGTYRISQPIPPISGDDIHITADPGTVILYTGPDNIASTGAVLTFGTSPALNYLRLSLDGFRLDTLNTLSTGHLLRARTYTSVDLNIRLGVEYGTWRARHGVWLEGCTDNRLHESNICTLGVGVKWNNGAELHCGHATVKGLNRQGTAFLVGGGAGGFYAEDLTQLNSDVGMLIDTSLTAAPNSQFFFNGGTFDSNGTCHLRVNDALSSSFVAKLIDLSGWMSTTYGAGAHGVIFDAWTSGSVIGDPTILNNQGSGILLNDTSFDLNLGDKGIIGGNSRYAIESAGGMVVKDRTRKRANTLGEYGPNVIPVTSRRSETPFINPVDGWTTDASNNAVGVAPASMTALAVGSGLLVLSHPTTGDTAIYLCGGGQVQLLSASTGASWVAPTGSPPAGKLSVIFSGSRYQIVSNDTVGRNITVGSIKSRATA